MKENFKIVLELIKELKKQNLDLESIVKHLLAQNVSLAIIMKSLDSSGFSVSEVDDVLKRVEIPKNLNKSFEDLFFDLVDLE